MVDWRLSTGVLGQGREEREKKRKMEKDGRRPYKGMWALGRQG
jgi:hypothetical protein